MKKLPLAGAMIALTTILTACPGPNTPTPSTYSLTVNLSGVASAPVKVTNTTTSTTLFDGTLSSGKTFSGIAAGTVLKVEGGAVNTFATPAAQTVTLDADKTVTLEYKAAPQGSPVNQTAISGVINGSSLKISDVYLPTNSNGFWATSKVDAANAINLPLNAAPPSVDLYASYDPSNCQGTISNPQARMLEAYYLNSYSPSGDLLGRVYEDALSGTGVTANKSFVYRLYSTSDSTIKAICTYQLSGGGTYTEDVDISVKAGWNALLYTDTSASSTAQSATVRNVGSDVRTVLNFYPAKPKVSLFLNPSSLNFTNNDTVTVDADIVQVGGYSGTVSLSTDVAGLTVEPSSVSLTPLQAQSLALRPKLTQLGLGQQLLSTKLTFKYAGSANLSSQPFNVIVKDSAGQQVGTGVATVSAVHSGLVLYASNSGLKLFQGSSIKVPFTINSIQNFGGSVSVTAEGLPAGITMTPTTVNLSSNSSVYGELPLTASNSVVAGTYSVTLVATSGSATSRAKIDLTVAKPTVNVSVGNFSNPTVNAYQGSTAAVDVSVSTSNGFSGSTTLTLSGLPSGVTASPLTVQVTPGVTTTAKIPLTVAADAPLGNSRVIVTTPDIDPSMNGMASFSLSVLPPRTFVGTSMMSLAAAQTGVWVLSSPSYNNNTSTTVLKRYVGSQAVNDVTLNGSVSTLVPLGAGTVLAYSQSSLDGSAFTVTQDGQVSPVKVPFGTADTVAPVADAQGRIWFVQRAWGNLGGMTTALAYWTPSSGQTMIVDQTRDYGYSSAGIFSQSNDGRTILLSLNNKTYKIDTTSDTVTELALSGSAPMISNAGTLWRVNGSALERINADGTTNIFNAISVNTLIGFDKQTPNILWGYDYTSVKKIDTTTNTVTSYNVPNLYTVGKGAALLESGGVALVIQEYTTSGPTTMNYYLSVLK